MSGDAIGRLFGELGAHLDELLELLREADEPFWVRRIERALPAVARQHLAGATEILGLYGGEGTFSDLELVADRRDSNPARHVIMNRKLVHLRTAIFRIANEIASRTAAWR